MSTFKIDDIVAVVSFYGPNRRVQGRTIKKIYKTGHVILRECGSKFRDNGTEVGGQAYNHRSIESWTQDHADAVSRDDATQRLGNVDGRELSLSQLERIVAILDEENESQK